jgi:hypothetical protein
MGGLVWIASFPKSGNTWTRHFLHSLIRSPGKPHDINAMNNLTTGDSGVFWYKDLLDKKPDEASEAEISAVRPKAVKKIADSADGLVFVKTHNCMVSHHGTPMIEPSVTAGAIYIVRNPLDVAISYANHIGGTVDRAIEMMNTDSACVPSTEKQVYQYYGSWRENVYSWTRKAVRQLHVMRYEDMLDRPIETFGLLAQFLRLQPTRAELEAAIEASSFENLKEQEDRSGFKEKPKNAERFFRSGKSGEWRQMLSEAQIEAIVSFNRAEMERFGYWPIRERPAA